MKRRRIVPHKNRYYLQSKDPLFKEKLDKVVKIYKEIRDGTAGTTVTVIASGSQ